MRNFEIYESETGPAVTLELTLEQASDLIDRCLQSDIPDSPIFERTLALLLEAVGAIDEGCESAA